MARPGFVLSVDDRTPPLLVAEGGGVRLQRFPLGTEVVYPGDTAGRRVEPGPAIAAALAEGLDAAPLAERLRPGMRLTITVTALQEPASRGADVRQQLVEQVLQLAAEAGVEDVVVLMANGIGPRLTESQLREVLGERVVRSFLGEGRLRSHDALDPDGCTEVVPGVRLDTAVAEADLVVDVSLAGDAAPDLGRTLVENVCDLATQRRLRGLTARSEQTAATVAAAVAALPLVGVRAVVDQVSHPPALEFLGRREWEWRIRDRATWLGLRRLSALTPDQTRRSLLQAPAARPLLAVAQGEPAAVQQWSRSRWEEPRTVGVPGQADVLVVGVPHRTPHNPDAAVDPLVAAWSAVFGSLVGEGRPPVRAGGALIAFHPLAPEFSARVHPSAADFYADVLSLGALPAELADLEQRYAEDEWYASLYRHQHAHAGVLPFQLWYEIAAARELVGQVIWVGADRATAERMGFRAASTLADALEIASDAVGRSPRVRYLHSPPGVRTLVEEG